MMAMLKWYKEDTDEFVIEAMDKLPPEYDPECPLCGKTSDWWEGTVDQDRQGNDITAGYFICHECHISTKLQYLD